ncbi:MAG: GNAT family N-acetyltransferase [Candidatus Latescibacteria bacterium]|nr:GNAT family N-acetyltransferase [Candidatus Latescibacterota bacterium]
MSDMLVPLLDLPPAEALIAKLRTKDIVIRRAYPFEITPVRAFAERHFGVGWADEISVGFSRMPVSVFVAIDQSGEKKEIVGFAAYECTARDYFGPTGVAESHRKRGIGRALLLASLHGLRELGYVYAIIGGAGPVEYYAKAAGATLIENSEPGLYRDLLR